MTRRQRSIGLTAALLAALALWWSWPAPGPAAPPPAPLASAPEEDLPPEPEAQAPEDAPEEAPAPEPAPPDDPHEALAATCHLSPPLAEARGFLAFGSGSTPPYDGLPIEIVDGAFRVPPMRGLGSGVLTVEGFAPARIMWGQSDGLPTSCAPDPIRLSPGDAWVTGRVRNAEGEPEGKVFVEGCGTRVETDADGSFAMTVLPGRCTLDAFRRDGLLLVSAGAADIEPAAGDEVVVDFVLPDLPRGGLGITIRESEDGIHVLDVLPGTASAEAGLLPGDVVVEVDGTETAGMDVRSFVDLATGPVGTEVDIVVLRDGLPEALTLERRLLEGG